MRAIPVCPNPDCRRFLRWVGRIGPADSGWWCDECDSDPFERDVNGEAREVREGRSNRRRRQVHQEPR